MLLKPAFFLVSGLPSFSTGNISDSIMYHPGNNIKVTFSNDRGLIDRSRNAHFGFQYKEFSFCRRYHSKLLESSRISIWSAKIVAGSLSSEEDRNEARWQREEKRWHREEERWLREEQRWLREEARWHSERNALIEQSEILKNEIAVLQMKVDQLEIQKQEETENDRSIADLIVSLTKILQTLEAASSVGSASPSTFSQIPSSATSARDISTVLEDINLVQSSKSNTQNRYAPILSENETVDVSSEIGTVGFLSQSKSADVLSESKSTGSSNKTLDSSETVKRTLKRGAEGDDVKAMQEALLKLGFYSGEDDMEYSTFSSGTERAVRTWQATLGISEDGIVTTELLVKLFGGNDVSEKTVSHSENANESPERTQKMKASKAQVVPNSVPSKQSHDHEKVTGVINEVYAKRVYLLGENRWEEPDRLLHRNGSSFTNNVNLSEKCFSCKGQGNTMCTECEGTGELNVEEQFLEWVEEGAKCPYCEGEGVINCDVCDGKGVKAS